MLCRAPDVPPTPGSSLLSWRLRSRAWMCPDRGHRGQPSPCSLAAWPHRLPLRGARTAHKWASQPAASSPPSSRAEAGKVELTAIKPLTTERISPKLFTCVTAFFFSLEAKVSSSWSES